ncbi:MAG TPA: SusC/RagA family TonB-linked outer membrane protein, partial [Flavobacteriaceae bacterium]|nr:SusC/RagA family TonB-linked outer membrane protein [Flavobacteriaceae bacterium]
MRTKFSGILTLLLAFAVQLSFAQQKTITGTVTDETGMPLPGVNIVIVGTTTGTQSDFDGNYSINANVGQAISFSYLGYQTTEVPVTASTTTISLQMSEDAATLEEVIVTAYGRKRTKNEYTGSVVTVGSEDLMKIPNVSVEQALQGRVAGLAVNTTSGTPGASQQIRIRGQQSITASNQPLYVIDGVPITSGSISGSANVSSMDVTSMLSMDNIESITVLKDAVSVAPYGAAGSNGVIMITTKSGKQGKARFSLVSRTGVINNARKGLTAVNGEQKWDLVQSGLWNMFGEGGTGAIQNNTETDIYNHILNTPSLANQGPYRSLVAWNDAGRPGYDWVREVSNNDAFMQNIDFSMTQGNEVSNMYASLGYNYTESTVIGSDFERINGSFRYNSKLGEKFNLGLSAIVSNVKQNASLEQSAYFSNPNLTKYFLSPWINPYAEDGSPNISNEDFVAYTGMHNTLFTANNNIYQNDVTRAIPSLSLSYQMNDKLSFSTLFTIDYTLAHYKQYASPQHGDGLASGGYIAESSTRLFNYVSQNTVDYKFNIGDDHNFNLTALSEFSRYNTSYLEGYGENMANNILTNISAATANYSATSSFSDRTSLRYAGMLSYNYQQKYLIDATYSYQGDSRFSRNQRFDSFYTVGLGWNLHRENFLSDVSFVNELRIKGSYGTVGNSEIGRNTFQALSGVGDYNSQPALIITGYGSTAGWETGLKRDVAIDFTLWNRRIKGTLNYYDNDTRDMLLNFPLGWSAQFLGASAIQNIGEMNNKGFEIDLGVDIIQTDDFNWNFGFIYANNENLVTYLPEDAETITATRMIREGHRINEWYLVEWAGVDPATGDPQWWTNTPVLDNEG